MKYVSRAGKKGSVYADLIKAKDYGLGYRYMQNAGDEDNMKVKKRDNSLVEYDAEKICIVLRKQ